MRGKIGIRIGSVLGYLILAVILLAANLFFMVFNPCFQTFAVKGVCEGLSIGDRKIDVGHFRLSLPLTLDVDDLIVVEQGDTTIGAKSIDLDMALMPLLAMRADIHCASIVDGSFTLGSPDSTMYMTLRRADVSLSGGIVSLAGARIELDRGDVSRGDIFLALKPDTTPIPLDTVKPTPWFIHANEIEIKNIHYAMTMVPTIDTIMADVPRAMLRDGTVDMSNHAIHARLLDVADVTARYVFPAVTPEAVPEAENPNVSVPWRITADRARLTAREGLYAMNGAKPLPGLDFNYIKVNDIELQVDSFYNEGVGMRVPLTTLRGYERSGLRLEASGVFAMDSAMMRANDFVIKTPQSTLDLDAYMGIGNLTTDSSLPLGLKLDGELSLYDMRLAFPSVSPMLKGLPQNAGLRLGAQIGGTAGSLDVKRLAADLPGHVRIALAGKINNAMDPERIDGALDIDGQITDLQFAKNNFLDPATAKMVNIAPLSLDGHVIYKPNAITGDLTATSGQGRIALDADWVKRAESYDAQIEVDQFPVNAFLPTLEVGPISGTVTVNGHGYDIFSSATAVTAQAVMESAVYKGKHYTDLGLWCDIVEGMGKVTLASNNPDADFEINGSGNLSGDTLVWDFDGDVRNIDLYALRLTEAETKGSTTFKGAASMSSNFKTIDATVNIGELIWSQPGIDIDQHDIMAHLTMSDSLLSAQIDNADLQASADIKCSISQLSAKLDSTMSVMAKVMAEKRVDVTTLQQSLPQFDMSLMAGSDNIISDILAGTDMDFDSLWLAASNDSIIRGAARVSVLRMGNTKIDSISADIYQHDNYLYYKASMRNAPGTLDKWAWVDASGYIADDNVAIMFHQKNLEGKTGFMVGAMATMTDSLATINFAPYHPIIGYKKWDINADNMVSYNFLTQHLDANLRMSNSNGSTAELYTEHQHGSESQEDVVVKLTDIQIADWIAVNPFAPPISGAISADMRFNWDKTNLNGHGNVGIAKLTYGRESVGDFDLAVDVSTSPRGATKADVSLMVDGVRTITASGALNDSTLSNPFMLDFSMIHFPLKVVNPFLPPGTGKLSGSLNGKMDITGSMSSPKFDGYLNFDSAEVKIDMLGTKFTFSDANIPVDSNIIQFNNFAIKAVNDNPLRINGAVDMGDMLNPGIDLSFNAKNMQIVGSSRPYGADVYGKAFIDLNARVNGNMQFLNAKAQLDILAGTNVTYILPDVQSAITNQSSGDMVHFVSFADTAQVAKADTVAPSGMLMNIDAMLRVNPGSTITVDLTPDGKSKVQVAGQGTINYTMDYMDDSRTTGRYTISKGFARYAVPMIGEKRFDFIEGSYVAFNGNMLNPILNVHAVNKVKANVTQEGHNSRLVNFDVGLSVTNTLENMNVAFDLSTNDDITVENELQSMSPEQRANQAMNIMLYGIYTGAGTKGDANIGGNLLYSYLESTLNTWAANNIKGVDLSFGIDQYNQTVDGANSTTTNYSYQVSKSMFNDRFKIVVGGNYTTDANTDENFAQNLINDISFEYLLNRSGTMYIKLFRHVGYESILEGEVTQTGVGFVYKRKISKIGDMFRWFPRRRKNKSQPVATPEQGAPVVPANGNEK